jgi:hypothetical protein
MDAAREADLGLPEFANNPFNAETAPVGDAGLETVVCERAECEEMDEASLGFESVGEKGTGLMVSLDLEVELGAAAAEVTSPWARIESITSMSPRGSLFPSVCAGIKPARTVLSKLHSLIKAER